MIRLTRLLPDGNNFKDDREVFLDPAGIEVIVQHEGKTTVVMSGPQLLYNVIESRLDVLILKAAWSDRARRLDSGVVGVLFAQFDTDGAVEFVIEDN